MDTLVQASGRDLYDSDEHAWLLHQIGALRAGRLRDLDRDSLAEYLQDMGRRDEREVMRRMAVLFQHLLKLRFQPERLSRSWVLTLLHQQAGLRDILGSSASLAAKAEALGGAAYQRGAGFAAAETGLPLTAFPKVSPWTVAATLAFEPPEPRPPTLYRRKRP